MRSGIASKEGLRNVARGNPKPCLPRSCTLRLKGRILWRRLIQRIFSAPTPPLRCRRPYTGVSRSPRRMAKRAASPCRSESEAVCAPRSVVAPACGHVAGEPGAAAGEGDSPPLPAPLRSRNSSPSGTFHPSRGARSISQLDFKDGNKTLGRPYNGIHQTFQPSGSVPTDVTRWLL